MERGDARKRNTKRTADTDLWAEAERLATVEPAPGILHDTLVEQRKFARLALAERERADRHDANRARAVLRAEKAEAERDDARAEVERLRRDRDAADDDAAHDTEVLTNERDEAQAEVERLRDMVRGHESMRWPEEAHRLQQQRDEARAWQHSYRRAALNAEAERDEVRAEAADLREAVAAELELRRECGRELRALREAAAALADEFDRHADRCKSESRGAERDAAIVLRSKGGTYAVNAERVAELLDGDPADALRGGHFGREVYQEIAAERERAHARHGANSMESAPAGAFIRYTILAEEVGEIAKEFNEAEIRGGQDLLDLARLRTECLQVAAMACAWADRLGFEGGADDDR